eukprot:436723-Amphidinium_carterae.1
MDVDSTEYQALIQHLNRDGACNLKQRCDKFPVSIRSPRPKPSSVGDLHVFRNGSVLRLVAIDVFESFE